MRASVSGYIPHLPEYNDGERRPKRRVMCRGSLRSKRSIRHVSYMEDDTMWLYDSDRGAVADVRASAMGNSRGES